MESIYQQIWNADQMGNGIPALRPNEAKSEVTGYIIVNEPSTYGVDSSRKVLQEVHIPASKRETYRLCERLFDNYALLRSAPEIIREEETQEELDFIDAIIDTQPIQVARNYLQESLGLANISNENLAAMIKETWFKMGKAGSQQNASGFEHVFVGEQASKQSHVGGYHFWYKYHLDDGGLSVDETQGADTISYHGTKYHGADEPEKGVLVPQVVTLSLTWQAPAGDSNSSGKTLSKPIGGFFVGCSPEGLIALGLVRCRASTGHITTINGAEYKLDLHRLDNEPNSIRTFFPRFRRADVTDIHIDDNVTTPPSSPETETIEKPFRIIAAMVNPENPEGGREFLQIINPSNQTSSLANWQIVAPNGTTFTLSDIQVMAGDLFKFRIPKNEGVLRNKSGAIRLLDPNGTEVQVCTYTTEQARREGFPILF